MKSVRKLRAKSVLPRLERPLLEGHADTGASVEQADEYMLGYLLDAMQTANMRFTEGGLSAKDYTEVVTSISSFYSMIIERRTGVLSEPEDKP